MWMRRLLRNEGGRRQKVGGRRQKKGTVIPAKAGIHGNWVPAFAGMTMFATFMAKRGAQPHTRLLNTASSDVRRDAPYRPEGPPESSPRREPWSPRGNPWLSEPREGRQRLLCYVCRPFRGCGYQRATGPHGSRRGLPSAAAPRLWKSLHLK